MKRSLRSKQQPAGWEYYNWNSKSKKNPTGGLFKGRFINPPHSLEVPAVNHGMAGWHSTRQRILKPLRNIYINGNFYLSADYVGNAPVCFLAFLDGKGKFIETLYLKLAVKRKGVWEKFNKAIGIKNYPANAKYYTINLCSGIIGKPVHVSGSVYFDKVNIFVKAPDGNILSLRGNKFANWWKLGENVVFKPAGDLSCASEKLSGKIFDSNKKLVTEISCTMNELKKTGWRWQPAVPGFYSIEFFLQQGDIKTPVQEEYRAYSHITNQMGLFHRSTTNIAIVPDRTNISNQSSDMFGFNIMASYKRAMRHDAMEFKLAKLCGASFVRIHFVSWAKLEPSPKEYKWKYLDFYVDNSIKYGFKPVVNIFATPKWASKRPDDERLLICLYAFNGYAPKNMGDWTRLFQELLKRYQNKVNTWEVWNEPHLPGSSCFWNDSPEAYVKLLKAASKTIKKLQPEGKVWLGGIGMRYQKFYDVIIKLGAGKYFDVLPLHGFNVNPRPFYKIDNKYKSSKHSWVNSEWHACLVRYHSSSYMLSRKKLAFKMLLDMIKQIKLKVKKIAMFQLANESEYETLEFYSKQGMRFNHASGLFRQKPYCQARFLALAYHNFIHNLGNDIKYAGEYCFKDQKTVLLSSDRGKVLFFWQQTSSSQMVEPELIKAVGADSSCVDWEGKKYAEIKRLKIEPFTIYCINNPVISTSWKAGSNALELFKMKLELKGPTGIYTSRKLFNQDMTKLNIQELKWNSNDWKKRFNGRPSGNNSAKFALAVTPDGYIELVVETYDPIFNQPHSGANMWRGDGIEFAFDSYGKGHADDRVEFIAGLTPKGAELFKSKNATIDGDIPIGWSSEGGKVKNGLVKIRKLSKKRYLYMIRLKQSELYPLVFKDTVKLRFSILVNDNNGILRSGWNCWGEGIAPTKNATLYGTLKKIHGEN